MRWLRMLYLSNGFAVGALYGFVPVLLLAKGFDPALIGLTTSLGSVAYSFALPAWGHVGDVLTGPRRALQLACIPAAIFAVGLSAPLPVVLVIVCQVVISAGGGPTAALTDAMAMPILANSPREYSRLRLLSSFGGAAMAIVCGLLYSRTGYVAAPFVYVATVALMIYSAQKVPLGRDSERRRQASGELEARVHSTPARGRFGSVGEALSGRPRLLAVLASVLLIFIGFMAAATYISVRISDLGGGPMEVGLSNGVAWGAEVPGLILAGWLVGRVGLRPVLAVAAVGFAVCLASWIFFVDAGPILFTRFISGVFFGGILITFVLTIAQLLPAGLQSTGQTLFQAAAFGLAAVVANLVGGVLYSVAGPLGVFGGGAICTLAGGALGLVALPKVLTVPTSGVPEPLPLSV
ncbi:MAG TPA: MFS transporter [Terriglobales bacterium]|nr:MFS transporter [Terriglobales bacterium]